MRLLTISIQLLDRLAHSAASPASNKGGRVVQNHIFYEVFVTNNSLRKLIIMISAFIKCSEGKNKIPYEKIPYNKI